MRIRRNDSNNDWCFGHSQADFMIDNNLGVAQNIKTKLQEWKNDFFANLQAGIDYRTRLGNRKQKELLNTDIKTIITNVDEVIALTEYNSYLSDREITVNFSCITIYSQQHLTLSVSIEV